MKIQVGDRVSPHIRLRLWHSKLGHIVCALVTGNEHVWAGWSDAGAQTGAPLPMAYCTRCGAEF